MVYVFITRDSIDPDCRVFKSPIQLPTAVFETASSTSNTHSSLPPLSSSPATSSSTPSTHAHSSASSSVPAPRSSSSPHSDSYCTPQSHSSSAPAATSAHRTSPRDSLGTADSTGTAHDQQQQQQCSHFGTMRVDQHSGGIDGTGLIVSERSMVVLFRRSSSGVRVCNCWGSRDWWCGVGRRRLSWKRGGRGVGCAPGSSMVACWTRGRR